MALLPGFGDADAPLVRHPGVSTIAFTGSLPVGLEIVRAAADTVAGQKHIKRVVAELGGKNCVIVDADADLDEAVPEIVSSAFGYAGQKCSAAARVLVHEAVDELPFALTGGLFTRDPEAVRYVRRRSPVGNLYVNRGITGAMVGRQPFGGNRLSGTGSKAGGPDYLRHFVEPRAVSENTMRHGLVV